MAASPMPGWRRPRCARSRSTEHLRLRKPARALPVAWRSRGDTVLSFRVSGNSAAARLAARGFKLHRHLPGAIRVWARTRSSSCIGRAPASAATMRVVSQRSLSRSGGAGDLDHANGSPRRDV
jgi:hypothetical protein